MKKFILYSFTSLLLASCSLTEKYMADDVYLIKPSELGIGESTADETSYAAFKQRKTGVSTDRELFLTSPNFMFDNNPFGWTNRCWDNGYGWFLATSQHPYQHYGLFNRCFCSNWYYRDFYDYTSFPYIRRNGFWNGDSFGYAIYSSNYYGFGGYGWNGWTGSGWTASAGTNLSGNYLNGPRGSMSGYSNPEGRSYFSIIKSGTGTLKPGPKPNRVIAGTGGRVAVSAGGRTSTYEEKPVSQISKRPTTYPSNSVEMNKNEGNRTQTYVRSDAASRPRQQQYPKYSTSSGGRTNISFGTSGTTSNGSSQGRSSTQSSNGTSGNTSGRGSGGTSGGSTTGRRQ